MRTMGGGPTALNIRRHHLWLVPRAQMRILTCDWKNVCKLEVLKITHKFDAHHLNGFKLNNLRCEWTVIAVTHDEYTFQEGILQTGR